MRLEEIRRALEEKQISFHYTEEDGCGSIDFHFRGIPYHIWEFYDDREELWGVETNVINAGRSEDLTGSYEKKIAEVISSWPDMLPETSRT